jgi:hypothetical protein
MFDVLYIVSKSLYHNLSISENRLEKNLSILASDSFEKSSAGGASGT